MALVDTQLLHHLLKPPAQHHFNVMADMVVWSIRMDSAPISLWLPCRFKRPYNKTDNFLCANVAQTKEATPSEGVDG